MVAGRKEWLDAVARLAELSGDVQMRELRGAFADPTRRLYALHAILERPRAFLPTALGLVVSEAIEGMRDVPTCLLILGRWDRGGDRGVVVAEVESRIPGVLERKDEYECSTLAHLLETLRMYGSLEVLRRGLREAGGLELGLVAESIEQTLHESRSWQSEEPE